MKAMIKHSQPVGDSIAIGLSTLCFMHCLLLPVAVSLLPIISGSFLASEAFHVWMIIFVVPTSLYALSLGCKQHRKYTVLFLAGTGLVLLTSALFVGEASLGGYGEKLLTAIASILLAAGHIWNFKLCRQPSSPCECSNEQTGITKT